MLIKKWFIPLCDIQMKHNNGSLKGMANDTSSEMESDKTRLELPEADGGVVRKRNLRSQDKSDKSEDSSPEEDEDDIDEDPDFDKEDESDKSEDSSPEEDEDDIDKDPDFGVKKRVKGRNKSTKKEESGMYIVPKVKRNLSAYEEIIQKNREEKMLFLQSLNIEEAKAGLSKVKKKHGKVDYKATARISPPVLRKSRSVNLSEMALYSNALKAALAAEELKVAKVDISKVVGSMKNKKPTPIKRKYREIERISPPVLHKSSRLLKRTVDLPEEALHLAAEEPKVTVLPEMSFKEALKSEELYESYAVDVNIQESKSKAEYTAYDKSVLKNMTLSESNIAKVSPVKITALSWYQSPEQLIVAAGDDYGSLGVWNVDRDSNPYEMRIHLDGITNLQFNPFNQVQLISSSYDGILRCGDMVQHKFNEIYNVFDETCCTYFDILSATTYLVAQKNGQVALVDKRSRWKSCEKKHDCHDYSIKTVNIHPANKNFFITADSKGPIRLWDLRKLQKDPVVDIRHNKRCVQSAYFSPITGNSILATSHDFVSIFDSTKLTSLIKLQQQMKKDTRTKKILSVFRATWLPNSEEAFVIGSMQYPRRIDVFDKNMFAYNIMMHDNLTTITSTNAFHPMRPALAGGNSSGKVFVFI